MGQLRLRYFKIHFPGFKFQNKGEDIVKTVKGSWFSGYCTRQGLHTFSLRDLCLLIGLCPNEASKA